MNDEFRKFIVQPMGDNSGPTLSNGTAYVEVTDEAYLVYVHENDVIMASPRNLERAADMHCFSVQDLKELWEPSEENEQTIAGVASMNGVNLDDLIGKHAERLQKIYNDRTAGSYTFVGVLAAFLLELDGR